MRFLHAFLGLACLALISTSCSKESEPTPQIPQEQTRLHSEKITLNLESTLPSQSNPRSLSLIENGEALPKINPDNTTFTAQLYFKKMGVSGLGKATVTYQVAKINGAVKLYYYGDATFTSNFAAGVNPADGGEWYVAGIIGGGAEVDNSHFYQITFDRVDSDYARTDTKVRIPLVTKWTKMFNANGASAINGKVGYTSLHFAPQGTLVRVNLTTETTFKAGPTWASVVTNVLDGAGYFDFGAGSDADVRTGVYPAWNFSRTSSTTPALLNFKLQDQTANQMKTYYVWGMPRTGVSDPQTTVEAGFLNFVKSGTTETFASASQPQNGVSYPINLTLTEAGNQSILRPLFGGAYLNPNKRGVLNPTKAELQANMNRIGYFHSRDFAGDTDFTFGSENYELPDEFQWTSIFAGYNAGLVLGGGFGSNWSRHQNMPERVGSVKRFFFDEFKYQPTKRNKLYALKFQAYDASKASQGVYNDVADVVRDFPQAQTNAQRVAIRYTYSDPQGPNSYSNQITAGSFDIGQLDIEVVPLGVDDPRTTGQAITLDKIYDDAWWTARENEGVVRKASLLLPGVKGYNNQWRTDYILSASKFRALYSRVFYAGSDVGDQAHRMLLFAVHSGTLENSAIPQFKASSPDKRCKVGVFLFNTHH